MSFRKIKVDDIEYRYEVGSRCVLIRLGDRRWLVTLATLTGIDWFDIEKMQHKRSFHVKPRQIADYIKKVTA